MEPSHPPERLDLSIATPAGPVTATVEVSTGFVPVTQIVPLLRRLGQQAQALEQQRTTAVGQAVSCARGCAACCRMLVPVSVPEAFALRDMVATLPESRRTSIRHALAGTAARLEQAGLLAQLRQVAETDRPITDDMMEPVNRAYYALKLPCPFLENEACSIYEDRPAACRELLVTSPADWCQDMVNKPVRAIPVPLRVSTILGLLWSDLNGSPPRLIPLPLALDWAERHADDNRAGWKARILLDKALDTIWRFLSRQSAH
jgi:Fe-S-cluster containining protein